MNLANDIAIKVENLTKMYKIYNAPTDRMKEALHPFHKRYSRDFYALKDVSFTIRRGETMGFIGRNGAGKSTLLKLITGVVAPTSGTIQVNGRVASLLELGAGFNPELTGIQNIYMNGMIMGRSRAEMDARIEEIVAFADIGEFIEQPVKMYSSGMFARVAFAVNAFVEPDILIIDEALSVGDAFFQAKCMDKMKKMMDSGVTVLFVSHDWGAVKNLCQKGILLEHGRMMKSGTATEVVEEYRRMQLEARQAESLHARKPQAGKSAPEKAGTQSIGDTTLFAKNAAYQRIQNGRLEFLNVQLLDERTGQVLQEIEYGQMVTLRMVIRANEAVDCFGTGYHLRGKDGIDVVYGDSQLDEQWIYDAKPGECYVMDWTFQAELREGLYNIACVMSIPVDLPLARKVECCDFVPCALQFTVSRNIEEMGAFVHWHNDVVVKKI